jgi:hypothetical protein
MVNLFVQGRCPGKIAGPNLLILLYIYFLDIMVINIFLVVQFVNLTVLIFFVSEYSISEWGSPRELMTRRTETHPLSASEKGDRCSVDKFQ